MQINGRRVVPRSREELYRLLLDPDVLRRCLPNCEELVRRPDGVYDARIGVDLGLVRSTIKGQVRLTSQVPPERLSLEIQGKGGMGSLSGTLRVEFLTIEAGKTEVVFDGDVRFGGLLHAVGNRLLSGNTSDFADQFLSALAAGGGERPGTGTR